MSSDLRSLRRDVQPWFEALVEVARQAGLRPVVTSTVRSKAVQARLYRRWQAGLSPYPAAAPGTSLHEKRIAMDLAVTPMSALTELGALWESWGGTWGGRFDDPIHFDAR